MMLKKFLMLVLALYVFLLSSCEPMANNELNKQINPIDDIPLTTTEAPSYRFEEIEKYVVHKFSYSYEDASETYEHLKEKGIVFGTRFASFDYQDDEMFAGYLFIGTLTAESYASCEGKNFYELDFENNRVDLRCCLFYKEKYEKQYYTNVLGIDEFLYQPLCRFYLDYSFPSQNLKSIDAEKFKLVFDREDDMIYYYYIEYEGAPLVSIESHEPITAEFFNRIKENFVIFN